MRLRYAGLAVAVIVVLFLLFSGADWRLPGRDATIILIALAFGFYILGAKLNALGKD